MPVVLLTLHISLEILIDPTNFCLLLKAPPQTWAIAPPTAPPLWYLTELNDEQNPVLAAFSWVTTGFKIFQTSVVFHREMAVQHKAESHQTLLQSDCWDFSLQLLPGNQACTRTPTHWSLYSALTFSSSHPVSCENLITSKTAHLELLDTSLILLLLWDHHCASLFSLTSLLSPILLSYFVPFLPSRLFQFFFHLPHQFFSLPPLLLFTTSWIRLTYSTPSIRLWVGIILVLFVIFILPIHL